MLKQICLGIWKDVSFANKLSFLYNGNESSRALNNTALKRGRHLSAPSTLFFLSVGLRLMFASALKRKETERNSPNGAKKAQIHG